MTLKIHYRKTSLGPQQKWMAYTFYRWTSYKYYGPTREDARWNLIEAVKNSQYKDTEVVEI